MLIVQFGVPRLHWTRSNLVSRFGEARAGGQERLQARQVLGRATAAGGVRSPAQCRDALHSPIIKTATRHSDSDPSRLRSCSQVAHSALCSCPAARRDPASAAWRSPSSPGPPCRHRPCLVPRLLPEVAWH